MTTDASRLAAPVVGVGAATAFGWTWEALSQGLRSARCTVDVPSMLSTDGHRTRLASEVGETGAEQKSTRADQFAVEAAQEAWNMAFPAAIDGPEMDRVGVFFGGSTAGMAEAEVFFRDLLESGPVGTHLSSLASQQLNGPGDAVARALGVAGPVVSYSSACASGALAFGAALEALRSGEVDVAVAGGSDSLCQMTYAGFNALRAVDPARSRPFRAGRSGLNLGEGAGAAVLVNGVWAEQLRGAGVAALARLRGAGASCDAHHMTAPHPEGAGAAAAMAQALADGEVACSAVRFVNAHGTGTPHNDSAESAAVRAVFGELAAELPLTSVKGAIGHLLGSAGAVEAVATVLALAQRQVQPTAGVEDGEAADPTFGIDLVLESPRQIESGAAISNSFAFGGANATLVFESAP